MDQKIVEETSEAEEPRNDGTEGKISAATPAVEKIDSAPGPATAVPAEAAALPRREEPPNPLLLDPYKWDQCTITVGYSLLPDQTVSVSVHNHKDEPIVKTFQVSEVSLPEKINSVMAQLQTIWPASPVNVTLVLLPKRDKTEERPIIASVRVAADTPIVQEDVESNLPFPTPILAMLDELKALIPERGLKNIEKNARAKAAKVTKPAAKPAVSTAAPGNNKTVRKNQMTLF